MKNFSLLIKPASADCNLRCEYCFYIGHLAARKTRMSYEVLEKIISSYMSVKLPQYSFGWQGGEPMMMGIDFYKKAIELQKKYAPRGSSVSNGIQTNTTLVDSEAASFFKEYNFLTGVSLDGPAVFHDHYRKTVNGAPTHRAVMRGVENLRRAGADFNILTLVNNNNVKYPETIYKYLREKSFYYHQYIPCVEYDGDKPLPWTISGEEWGNFLLGIFNIWKRRDVKRVSVRFFDSILNYFVRGVPSTCTIDKNCCQYFVLEHNGDVFPCDFFVDEELKLGNIYDDDFESLGKADLYTGFGEKKADIEDECLSCPYLKLCHGGCQKNRILDRKTVLCSGYRMFYKEALPVFREMADDVRRNL